MVDEHSPVTINGAYGEGGSALLRTALAVSGLTSQPVRVHSIRGATRKPGLTSEDLTYLHAMELLCDATVEGADLDSESLTFVPRRPPRGLSHLFDIAGFEKGVVPGNALTVLQGLLPVLARSGVVSKVVVQGETYNSNALTYDAFELATLSAHRHQGLFAVAQQSVAGFGFGSRGEVSLEVEPSVLEGIDWSERGELVAALVIVSTAMVREDVGQRGVAKATELMAALEIDVAGEAVALRSRTPGACVTFVLEFERGIGSAVAIGQRGVRIEDVVQQAFDRMEAWYRTDATVDPYLGDQLLLAACMAEGPTTYRTSAITPRLQTMAWVIKRLMPVHITVLGRTGEAGVVSIDR